MEVQYRPNTSDYYAAQQHICRSVVRNSCSRFLPISLGGIFGICLAIGMLAILKFYDKYRFFHHYELNWGLGLIGLGFIAFIFGVRLYNRAIKSRMFNPDGLFQSTHTITIADDHLLVVVKNNEYTYSYRDILRVEDDLSYVYIFVDNGAAFYIPTKAFGTTEAKKSFINTLAGKIDH